MDHFGLASILARRSGAEVAALDKLAPFLAAYGHETDLEDRFAEQLMLRHGIPQEVVTALRAVSAGFRAWGASVEVTRPLQDGGELQLRDRTLRVFHRPGHSPSDTVFLDEDRSILLAADHLIKHISSNPLLARPLGVSGDYDGPRPQALITYMDSLEQTRAMDLALVLPGHGEPITDHVPLIDKRFRMHDRRAEKIHGLIATEPRTAHEIAVELWGNIAVTQAYLTLSEVLGHVDLLLADRPRHRAGIRRRGSLSRRLSDVAQKQPVNPIVLAELGVKGDRQHLPLPRGHGMTVHLREDLHAGAVLGDPGRTDEHRPQRATVNAAQLDVRLEAPQLAPERVALERACPSARDARGRA